MKTKILCIIAALSVVISLTACGNDKAPMLQNPDGDTGAHNNSSVSGNTDENRPPVGSNDGLQSDWRQNIPDSGYSRVFISTDYYGGEYIEVPFDKKAADGLAYIGSLVYTGDDYRPKNLMFVNSRQYDAIFENEDGSRNTLTFMKAEKNGIDYLGLVQGENVTWLTDEAVKYISQLEEDIGFSWDLFSIRKNCRSMTIERNYKNALIGLQCAVLEDDKQTVISVLNTIRLENPEDNYVLTNANKGDFCKLIFSVSDNISRSIEKLYLYYANDADTGLHKLGKSYDEKSVTWLTDEAIAQFEDYITSKGKAYILFPDRQYGENINTAAKIYSMPDIFGDITPQQAAEIMYADILNEFKIYSIKRPYAVKKYDNMELELTAQDNGWQIKDLTEYTYYGTAPEDGLLPQGAYIEKRDGVWYLDTSENTDYSLAQPVELKDKYDSAVLTRNVYAAYSYKNNEFYAHLGERVWDKDYTFELAEAYDINALLSIICDTELQSNYTKNLDAVYKLSNWHFCQISICMYSKQENTDITLVYSAPYSAYNTWRHEGITHALGIKTEDGIIWLSDDALERFEELCRRNGITRENFLFAENELKHNLAYEEFVIGLDDHADRFTEIQAAEILYTEIINRLKEPDPKRPYTVTGISQLKLSAEDYGNCTRIFDYATVLEFEGVLSTVDGGAFVTDMGAMLEKIDGVWYLRTFFGDLGDVGEIEIIQAP